MEFKCYTAGPDDNDRRLDKIIRKFLPEISLSQVYKYIRKGLIKINGSKAKNDSHVNSGDQILIADFILSSRNESAAAKESRLHSESGSQNLELNVIFENEHILVINKPYDIKVHGDKASLDSVVQKKYKALSSLSFKPGPLHRLDRKTTGLLSFSKSLEGARWFSENIKNHIIQKKYIALVQGKLTAPEHYIDSIAKIEKENQNEFFKVNVKEGLVPDESYKYAETFIKPIASGFYNKIPVTFVEIQIKTGRTHQIRSQCALHKHPLLGDTAYGGTKLQSSRDFFLQAFELIFPSDNPLKLPQKIKIIPDNDFIEMLKSCCISEFSL